jgi:hypothetical protein
LYLPAEFILSRKYMAPKRAPSQPFNSDAFTAFGTVDPGIKEDNEDIRKEVQVNLPLQLSYFHEYFSSANEYIRDMGGMDRYLQLLLLIFNETSNCSDRVARVLAAPAHLRHQRALHSLARIVARN